MQPSVTLERCARRGELEPPPAPARAHIRPAKEELLPADAQLLGRAAADPSGLAPLYDRHAKRVFALALKILRSRQEAEDLTHDIFVSLCRPTAYDPARGTVEAFLISMTRSRAIDRLRRRPRSTRLHEIWGEVVAAAPAPTQSEQLSMRRMTERIYAALAALPRAQRQVVELAYYRGLSQREIAAELATPLGTVKSWSRRALQALNHALSDITV